MLLLVLMGQRHPSSFLVLGLGLSLGDLIPGGNGS
jgi:hypothetical protein